MSYEFEKEGLEVRKGMYLDVVFHVADAKITTDGIGAYEFWGAKGFDAGQSYVEEYDIPEVWVWSERRKDNVTVSNRLEAKIKDMLFSDDKLQEEINKKIMDDLNQEPDCPDEDC